MSGATDSGMVKTMTIVMGALALLAILCMIAARMLGVGADDSSDPLKRNALIQRIEPVASVRTSADDLPASDTVAVADAGSSAPKTGEELVNGACAACHVAGVAGAPLLGDEAAWAERREAGLDALVASVINGKGSMPARGGSTYTDEEITKAVQHIALFEVDEAAAPVEAEPASATDESTAEAEPAEEAPSEEVAEAATEEAPAAEETASEETAAVETATEEVAEKAAAADEAPVAEAVAEASVAALVVGQVPDGLTDNIKGAVDGVCAGCHLAGVAGAPKTGDREAWQLRADKGLDVLTASVINGLNVMPPRGGSGLSDEEIPIAIQYLMSK